MHNDNHACISYDKLISYVLDIQIICQCKALKFCVYLYISIVLSEMTGATCNTRLKFQFCRHFLESWKLVLFCKHTSPSTIHQELNVQWPAFPGVSNQIICGECRLLASRGNWSDRLLAASCYQSEIFSLSCLWGLRLILEPSWFSIIKSASFLILSQV